MKVKDMLRANVLSASWFALAGERNIPPNLKIGAYVKWLWNRRHVNKTLRPETNFPPLTKDCCQHATWASCILILESPESLDMATLPTSVPVFFQLYIEDVNKRKKQNATNINKTIYFASDFCPITKTSSLWYALIEILIPWSRTAFVSPGRPPFPSEKLNDA